MKRIVSAVPGRIRVRDAHLREPARHAALQDALGALDGAIAVEGNTVTGSVLLRYDASRVAPSAMEASVEAAAAALIVQAAPAANDAAASPPDAAPASRVSSRALARRLNGYAKIGMLGSLGASLALAAAGSKKAHIATGSIFLGLLGIHMAVHRRHLIK